MITLSNEKQQHLQKLLARNSGNMEIANAMGITRKKAHTLKLEFIRLMNPTNPESSELLDRVNLPKLNKENQKRLDSLISLNCPVVNIATALDIPEIQVYAAIKAAGLKENAGEQ
ncbi:hypothetical protein J5X92_01880 [Alteromonas sp. K632G]|uniref:hypothetical protein n=1 Tax=Alteromonas sp. K632G TaxID=2820757 RepID=UPI001AD6D98D|nr:hypothetical protein [Alteromonas sp. K632G]MBO7920966.1 hypothetical protein [Alteromonas sp. K632G]